MYKKFLVCEIILLFFGAGAILNVSGIDYRQTENIALFQETYAVSLDLEKDFVPGEFIVKFKEDIISNIKIDNEIVVTGLSKIDSINLEGGIIDYESICNNICSKSDDFKNIYKFVTENETDIFSIIEKYMKDPDVIYAEPNYIYHTCITPNDPHFDEQWALNQSSNHDIDAPEAWDIETGDEDIVIAIIDTGVDYNHIDILGNIWNNTDEVLDGNDTDMNGYIDDVKGWDFFNNGSNPMDDHGHGTHCSGIASAVTNNSVGIAGICWNCTIMPIRIGAGPSLSLGAAIEGIIYATDNGADIISMSWGDDQDSNALRDALNYAYSQGVILVAAAGNDHTDYMFYPSGYDNVIAVAATKNNDEEAIFSNYGSWVDIAAPGYEILSLRANDTDMYGDGTHIVDEEYYIASGTSMSCPHVAGLIALILSKNPDFTPMEVLTILRSTTDIPDSDKYIGVGRINAHKAIQIDNTTIANLDSSLDGATIIGNIDIVGTANGSTFTNYTVYYGSGVYPNNWTEISNSSLQVNDSILATWEDTSLTSDGVYTIRLRVNNIYNQTSEDRVVLTIKNVYISSPTNYEIFKNQIITINGSTKMTNFESYKVEYANVNDTSVWHLINESTTFIIYGTLAIWNATSVNCGTYILRLTVNNTEDVTSQNSITIIIDKRFVLSFSPGGLSGAFNQLIFDDMDGDVIKDVIIGSYDGRVYALKGDGNIVEGWPLITDGDAVEMASATRDIDNDGVKDIIVPNTDLGENAKLYRFTEEGAKVWEQNFDGNVTTVGTVTLADVTDDGFDEIIVATKSSSLNEYYLRLINHNGEQLWQKPLEGEVYRFMGQFTDTILAVNLTGDEKKEIVVPVFVYGNNKTLKIKVFDNLGLELFTYTFPKEPEGIYAPSNIVSLYNEDDEKNVVIFAKSFYNSSKPKANRFNNTYYILIENNGTLILEEIVNETDVGNCVDSISLGDVNNDGEMEIVSIGNKIGGSTGILYGAVQVKVYDLDGVSISSKTIDEQDYGGKIGMPFIADITGDDVPELFFMTYNVTMRMSEVYAVNYTDEIEILNGFPIKTYFKPFALGISDITGNDKPNLILAGHKIQVWEIDNMYNKEEMDWPMFQYDSAHSGFYIPPELILPEITDVSNIPDITGYSFNITIRANITDINGSGVKRVRVEITYPDNYTNNFMMDNTQNNTYECVFSDTWQNGQYNYSIWATDNAENINSSSVYAFNVSTQCNLSLQTTKYHYIDNEYVNLTNSKINNIGDTDCRGYLLMGIEYYNSGNWTLEEETVDETTARTILHGEYLQLDSIFNDKVNTSNLFHETGQYRVYAIFRDPDGNILFNNDDTLMQAYCEFNCTLKISNVSNMPEIIGYGYNVTIIADIVGDVNISTVNITYPDDSVESFTMNHVAGIEYECVFNNTWQKGQYNYTIWVIDNDENTNISSRGYNFNVSTHCNISLQTLDDEYVSNEDINITGMPEGNWLNINSTNLDSYCGGLYLDDALDGTGTWLCWENHIHWFILDLGKSHTITKIWGRSNHILPSFGEDPSDVNVYVSEVNGSWGSPVKTNISTWQDTTDWQIVNTSIKYGRYVQVEIKKTDTENNYLAWGDYFNPMTIFDVNGTETIYSIINNVGDTDCKGHLQMGIEYNNSGNWTLEEEIVNETTSRTIVNGSYLKLDNIFNDKINTSVLDDGHYRVYVKFCDPDGNVLINDDDTSMIATYEFNIAIYPPEIDDVSLIASDPLDTDPDFGWENITCNVTDNVGVNDVKLNVTYNGTTMSEYSMANIPGTDTYYYNTTFTDEGCHQYYIWAENLNGVDATSSSQQFELPPNEDVNMNGQIQFMDLVAITLMYGEYGPYNGWVREDVDNNGQVHFMDLTTVNLRYGEYWDTCGGESSSGGGFGGNAIVSIQPSSQTVEKGETFTVSVYVEPDEPIMGAAFDSLYYDADLIHANSVTEGNLFNNHLIFNDGNIDNENGVITDVYIITEKAKHKSGTLVNIEFTAQQELGISDLNLEGVLIANENNERLHLEINDGTVTVQ